MSYRKTLRLRSLENLRALMNDLSMEFDYLERGIDAQKHARVCSSIMRKMMNNYWCLHKSELFRLVQLMIGEIDSIEKTFGPDN